MARIDTWLSRPMLAVLTLAVALLPLGCTANRYTFESSAFSPKTVEVVDQLAMETVWAMDVPVGQKLILDFNSKHEGGVFTHDPTPPTSMTWELQRASRHTLFAQHYIGGANDKGEVVLNGNPVITRVTVREVNRELEEPMPELFVAPTEPASFSEPESDAGVSDVPAEEPAEDVMDEAPSEDAAEDAESAEDEVPLLEGAPD
ncbi:hypothetical protein [Mucisphaera calidilacus]|uniref:Uncharacterized protein n=1 Tax=Mucisphaera calidilacus TaxID=2527982 RepID=A0A518C1D8_9BACT|nr:hypothetical protein [Mucisphaera calidilacus]QDU73028.1 hypothetical protein Pan265_29060 [Mucisphaera calidilacus]